MITSSTPNKYNNESQRNLQDESNRTDHTVVLSVNDDNGNDDGDIITEGATVVLSPPERLNQQIRDGMYRNAITVKEDCVVALLGNVTPASATTFTTNTVPGDT